MKPSKKCSKCGKYKDPWMFSKRSKNYKHKNYGDGYESSCKSCNNLRKKLWAQKNKERINKERKEWYKNPEVRKKLLAKEKIYGAKFRDEMSDTYIKRLLVRWNSVLLPEDIPGVMVEAKREHLKLKRLLKEKNNG